MIRRDGCCLEEYLDVENLILSVKKREEIVDAPRCEHRTLDYLASGWLKIAQEMGVGQWSAWCFVACCDDDDDDVHNNKNNSTTNNSINVLIVIRPFIQNVYTLFLVQ